MTVQGASYNALGALGTIRLVLAGPGLAIRGHTSTPSVIIFATNIDLLM